jgi:N6-adenosine-specific RNA methylase IME4
MRVSEELKELIEKLPPDLQKLELSWRGALRDLRNKFSSVGLQHKSLDWWGD